MKTATIKKDVPGIGEVEFTGHLWKDTLEDITWPELEYSTEQNGKIADVCDNINEGEFISIDEEPDTDEYCQELISI